MKVFKLFHPWCNFVWHGTARAGEEFPTEPRLRTLEFLYAAMLVVPVGLRRALRSMVASTAGRVAVLHGATGSRDAGASSALARARLLHMQAVGMDRLVNLYVPLVFYLGHMVRECTWAGRDRGSGKLALNVIRASCALLLGLCGDRAQSDDYFRCGSLILMLWREWYSDLMAVCHCEEVCERMLGRFKERLLSHTEVFDVDSACDLYLEVRVRCASRACAPTPRRTAWCAWSTRTCAGLRPPPRASCRRCRGRAARRSGAWTSGTRTRPARPG